MRIVNNHTMHISPFKQYLIETMKYSKRIAVIYYLMMGLVFSASAQIDVACINHINFSLDPTTCTGEITPEMVMVGDDMCAAGFEISITNDRNRPVDNSFTIDDVGETFTYMLCCETNCCWGTVTVEYKSSFGLICPADDTIPCGSLDFFPFFDPITSTCSSAQVVIEEQTKEQLICDTELTALVTRVYKISDDFGNVQRCNQNIALARLDPRNVLFPGNTSVTCSDTTLVFNDEGNPIPWIYQPLTGSGTGLGLGVPVICGVSAPFGHFFPDMSSQPVPNGEYGSAAQNVGGTDPSLGFFCPGTGSGTGAFPLIPIGGAVIIVETGDVDNPIVRQTVKEDINTPLFCNTQLTFSDVSFPPINGNCNRKIARTWELREWWCTDELLTTSLQIIEIIDDQAPAFVCPADYTVSTGDDCASTITLPKLNAIDACGSSANVRVQFAGGIVDGDGQTIALELGKNPITFVVSDDCHNSATCATEVTVVDARDPVAICDPDKVVALSTLNDNRIPASTFDRSSFDECGIDRMEARRMNMVCDGLATEWSEYVSFCCEDVGVGDVMVAFRVVDKGGNASVCMVRVEVQDKLIPDLTCPPDMTIDCSQGFDPDNLALTFGFPSFDGSCDNTVIPVETLTSDVNQCGIGFMTRTFSIRDANGQLAKTCSQELQVLNENPFSAINITWPLDYEQNDGCGQATLSPDALPDAFGFPSVIGSSGCNLLGFDYVDKILSADPGSFACVIIERTWTVVNWCSSNQGEFDIFRIPEPQILRLRNTTAPVLDNNMEVTHDAHNSDCASGDVTISRTASDDCIQNLTWMYVIRDFNGQVVERGESPQIQGSFPVGLYEIEWTVSDGCGNTDSDLQTLNVFDSTPPTPICRNGISVSLSGHDTDGDGTVDTETAELWASDFDAGIHPNCGHPIVFSFTADTSDRMRIVDCANLGRQTVTMWVTDVLSGAQDFCTGFVDVQDEGLCPDQNITVSGQVHTESFQSISDVEVMLELNAGMDITDETGTYAFRNMPLGGDYRVLPQRDNDHHNGVSTVDIILIQRHILGIELLDGPYKHIAADIDNNQRINGVDLVELRKLVLGIYSELPLNDSWRFISEHHVFTDPTDPWAAAIPENHDIVNLSSDVNLDFIGVKIGDVNDDVILSVDGEEEEHETALHFTTPKGNPVSYTHLTLPTICSV